MNTFVFALFCRIGKQRTDRRSFEHDVVGLVLHPDVAINSTPLIFLVFSNYNALGSERIAGPNQLLIAGQHAHDLAVLLPILQHAGEHAHAIKPRCVNAGIARVVGKGIINMQRSSFVGMNRKDDDVFFADRAVLNRWNGITNLNIFPINFCHDLGLCFLG